MIFAEIGIWGQLLPKKGYENRIRQKYLQAKATRTANSQNKNFKTTNTVTFTADKAQGPWESLCPHTCTPLLPQPSLRHLNVPAM